MLNDLLENVPFWINDRIIFISGGTGSFGNMMVETITKFYQPKKLIIFSRDEFKQYNMKQKFPEDKYDFLRYFIGDIRDYERLIIATKNVDIIFHAAAMKQVDTIEYNPLEAIKTNINGVENMIKAAINNNVKKFISISTDKCVHPINLYGATKLCLEKLTIHANLISDQGGTIFSVLRYGNVVNSRGSVIPKFFEQSKNKKEFTITDPKMTRFTLTIEQAIYFALNSLSIMIGGEIFVPKLKSYDILQLARCIDDTNKIKIIGKRPGEKIHEIMISNSESHNTIIENNYFIIIPDIKINKNFQEIYGSKYLPENWEYSSGENDKISDQELYKIIK